MRGLVNFGKRQSNKKLRKLPVDVDIPKGRYYQKFYNSAIVCDGKWMQTEKDEILDWYQEQSNKLNGVKPWMHKHYNDTLEEALSDWKRWYIRK